MVTKTPSAWAVPEHTPAHKPAADPLVVVYSEAVSESEWSKVLPTSPKGFAKLAKDAGWHSIVRHALAKNSNSEIESWGVWSVQSGGQEGAVAIWEFHRGEVPDSKKKWSVSMAYRTSVSIGLIKMKITELKNIIKDSM